MDIIVESAEIKEKGELTIYEVKGYRELKTGKKKLVLFGPNKDITEKSPFTVQMNAHTGKIVGFK